MKRVFFLDRDGTINIDYNYIRDPALVTFFPGVPEAIRRANEAGWMVVVVTNQSGVNRGLIKPEELAAVHSRMNDLLAKSGAHIDHWQICTHAPAENCGCRKPSPKLILDFAREEGIDLAHSVMVGDRIIDVAAGKAAGCKALLVRTGCGVKEENLLRLWNDEGNTAESPDAVVDDLAGAVSWGLEH